MKIEFRKGKQRPTLVCSRKDGTRTWKKTSSYILRDLAHYVVETNLCYNMGFYGLVRVGIDVSYFANEEGIPEEMPLHAFYSEQLVNILLSEMNERKARSNFQRTFDDACQRAGRPTKVLSEDIIDKVRAQIKEFYERWNVLEPGEKLTLEFTVPDDKGTM